MDELEELKKEKARLQALAQAQQDMGKRQNEKNKLKRKIWGMKHPKIVKVVRVAKDSTVGVGMIFKEAGKRVAPYAEQGLKNFAQNAGKQYREGEEHARRVTKKVCKSKVAKSKKKRVKKVVVRSQPNIGFPNPFN